MAEVGTNDCVQNCFLSLDVETNTLEAPSLFAARYQPPFAPLISDIHNRRIPKYPLSCDQDISASPYLQTTP